jgi:hypothetical protein
VFVTLMVIGLVGLVTMAIPAFGRHGHGPTGGHAHALGPGHAASAGHAGHGHSGALARTSTKEIVAQTGPTALRFLPSPRAAFSTCALYGAFGNLLMEAHLPLLAAAFVAVVPSLLVERFMVTPLWNRLLGFQGAPSAPLEELILAEATAVTPFRNGRGLVSVVRAGRMVQLSARLCDEEAALPIKTGDRLLIQDIDAKQERVTVSVARAPVPNATQ